jgi:hypothetical protein
MNMDKNKIQKWLKKELHENHKLAESFYQKAIDATNSNEHNTADSMMRWWKYYRGYTIALTHVLTYLDIGKEPNVEETIKGIDYWKKWLNENKTDSKTLITKKELDEWSDRAEKEWEKKKNYRKNKQFEQFNS